MVQNSRYGAPYAFEFITTSVLGFVLPFDSPPEGLEVRMSTQSGFSHQIPSPPIKTPANVKLANNERTVREIPFHSGPNKSFDSAHSNIQFTLLAIRAGRRMEDRNFGARPLSDAEIARNRRRTYGKAIDMGSDSSTARSGEDDCADDA